MTAELSLQAIQHRAVQQHLMLSAEDRSRVLEMLATVRKNGVTRLPLMVIVRFEEGEVVVVDKPTEFWELFEKRVYYGTKCDIAKDSFSIATLDRGEEAYQQYSKLTKFLDVTHNGWFLATQEGMATFKKPTRLVRRIAHAFESYDKRFTEYCVVWDLRKTDELYQMEAIAHSRRLLFEERLHVPNKKKKKKQHRSSDTLADASSDVFIRESPMIADTAKSGASSSSSSSSSREKVELASSAKEMSEEVKAKRAQLRSTDSSSSLSLVVPKKITVHRHKHIQKQPSTGSGSVSPDLTKKPIK